MTGRAIRHVAVVVPAHNEEEELGPALSAIRHAADALSAGNLHPEVLGAEARSAEASAAEASAAEALTAQGTQVSVSITVVLDSCTDGSRDIVNAHASADARVRMLETRARSTGASRGAGVMAALAGLDTGRRTDPDTVWLANTDADSSVPTNWLIRQVELANAGVDVVLGSVEPDARTADPGILRRWLELHPFREDHPHIYGANFGVRASAYLAVGGFPKLQAHEDRILATRLSRQGFLIRSTDTNRVVTSSRTTARAPQGFATYLRALGELAPVTADIA
ncbi:glycosyltransferase family 2 protein [Paenarthrobacter sp. YJN-5]|uniref:glycosyltransferase n=1 Tax=Paenarthrobacter sp. YJN-5 TaxID=2735316 RepID=UPI001877C63F|nr:glycosyltransferase [Paenarthrobacter sp. YJN-5]QOT15797.1 glycosyltransferase [Paenarthrobacter sp. YJN-5]